MIWYKNNNSDIVVSTRIRLARNVDKTLVNGTVKLICRNISHFLSILLTMMKLYQVFLTLLQRLRILSVNLKINRR